MRNGWDASVPVLTSELKWAPRPVYDRAPHGPCLSSEEVTPCGNPLPPGKEQQLRLVSTQVIVTPGIPDLYIISLWHIKCPALKVIYHFCICAYTIYVSYSTFYFIFTFLYSLRIIFLYTSCPILFQNYSSELLQ